MVKSSWGIGFCGSLDGIFGKLYLVVFYKGVSYFFSSSDGMGTIAYGGIRGEGICWVH